MATYWIHYQWVEIKPRMRDVIGTNAIPFEASSDTEAEKKTQQFMKDFRDNAPSNIDYQFLRLTREILAV